VLPLERQARIPDVYQPLFDMCRSWLAFRDPPDHTRLRALVSKAFTPRIVNDRRLWIETLASTLLDSVAQRGEMDLISDFAGPLPMIVITELLGLPVEDRERYTVWSHALNSALVNTERVAMKTMLLATRSVLECTEHLQRLIAKRRAQPRDDLISRLVAARDNDQSLTDDELVGTCLLLLTAGTENLTNLIGSSIYTLLRHPTLLERLREHPELIPQAVEELLRYESPFQMTARIAAADIPFGDRVLEKGQFVYMVIAAANRDPEHFEQPEKLNVMRAPNRHCAFGTGIHACLGATLARVEMEIALRVLLSHFPRLHLANSTPSWKQNFTFRGLEGVPVTWL
jgi:cytochrome P450